VDDAFVLETMFWPDEIRAAEFEGVDVDAKVRSQELEMAKQLIDNLTANWNPEEYRDEYREAMLEIVEKKIAGEEIEVVPQEAPAKVVDLMEALKASVAAAKSGEAEAPTGPEKSAARAKSTAKKSAAKKSTAKKPAAKTKKSTAARKKAVGE
jgi:DNA end-binding protein Ku